MSNLPTQNEEENLAIAQQAFPKQLFTTKQLFDIFKQSMAKPPGSIRTVQRWLDNWQSRGFVCKLGDSSSTQYTFDRDRASTDVSQGAQRFERFRAESPWKPGDRGNEPVFGHPTKKKNNNYWAYQISSSTSFQNPDYIKFLADNKIIDKPFSDETAREELNRAIKNKRLSKIGSNDARTYAIIEGEEPGYSSYVMPLNTLTCNEPLPGNNRD